MSTRRRYVRVATLGTPLKPTRRRHFALVFCINAKILTILSAASPSPDGNLYAVGGYDSSSHLATVEKYDPQVILVLGDTPTPPLSRRLTNTLLTLL